MSYQNPIELYVIIEQIVDSIRSTGSVSAYSEVNGTYTITSNNTLVNNDWITIDSIQYKVTDVSETGFTIKGDAGLNFTNAEWKANAPYFMCEKEPKAGNILTEKTKQDTYKWQKYPLFLLTRPYTDDRSNRMIGYSTDFSLHIITDTESTYWSDDRIDNNFTPTLYPLYNAFMNALPLNRWVKEKYLEKINHSKTDSMFIDANPFPDKMDGLTIDFTDLEILKNRQICGIDTPQIYTVDLSSTTGGEAVSSLGGEGVYNNVPKDSNEAFNATAESGSRFVRWLLNGVENLTNPLAVIIKKNYTIVAEFIQTFLLTTNVDGNGIITPLSGTYDIGETITITATPNDEDTVLDRIEKNNITVSTTSPYQFVINELSNVVAYFVALFTVIQDLFKSAPIEVNSKRYLPDETTENNNVEILEVQYANPTSNEYGVIVGKKITGGNPIYFKVVYEYNVNDSTFYANYDGNNARKGIIYRQINNVFYVIVGDGSSSTFSTSKSISTNNSVGDDITVEVFFNGVNTGQILINGIDETNTSNFKPWVGESSSDSTIFAYSNGSQKCQLPVVEMEMKSTGTNFHYTFKEGQDKFIFDSSNNSNHLELINLQPAFWDITGVGTPHLIINGSTLWENDIDDTKKLFAINSDNGTKINSIIGYSLIDDIEKNVIANNRNKYIWTEDVSLSQNDELVRVGIYSYEPDMNIVKSRWDGATEYTINENGTGDYATIRDAILDQNGTDYIIINVLAGTYYEQDIRGLNNVWLKGVGRGLVEIISDGLSTDISPLDYTFPTYANTAYDQIPLEFKHGFYVYHNFLATGLKSTVNDVKYNSHQDKAGDYESYFNECDFINIENNDISIPYVIGIGGRTNQIQNYIDCTFDFQTSLIPSSLTACVFYHNSSTQSKATNCLISKCTAISFDLLSVADDESQQNDLVTVNNCIISDVTKGIQYIGEQTTYTLWVLVVDTDYILTTSIVEIDSLSLRSGVDIIGKVSNFIEGSPYTGVTPQIVDFDIINSVENTTTTEINKTANKVSGFIVKE